MGLGQKIKDAVTPGHRRDHLNDPAYAQTGAAPLAAAQHEARVECERVETEREGALPGPAAAGGAGPGLGAGAGTGLGAGEPGLMGAEGTGGLGTGTREHHHHHHRAEGELLGAEGGAARTGGEHVCGQETFVQVEDRPIIKERVERVVEHRPVEKQYVQETRFVGERPVATATGETSLGVTERVVESTEPGPTCPNPNAPILNTEGQPIGHVRGDRTMDV